MVRLLMALAITIGIGYLFFVLRSNIAYKNRKKILNAINAYCANGHSSLENLRLPDNIEDCVDRLCRPIEGLRLLNNIEDYNDTLYRWWDFGCKNILPKEDYEIIKPYIKEKRNENSFR